ncbi:protein kinase family protein [Legionella drancourtii]|uniref:Protein kinase domain-containing protein n=1 Tax=Legionella drancourtii LLAP12 TaxID=658187 RepID=G9EPY3_9GAMM|nr:hypothetical protein [Legionella drancourtii]EHL30685.1 hypothetical protein LDG_7324 [Legionella drancourtii LLAP12]
MAKLIEVSDIRDLKELKTLVEHYNAIGDDNNSDIKKLFTLQRINYFIQKNLDNDAVVTWRNQLGESGLERHLQHYGIHRDSSQLLQSVEFANAVRHFTLNAPPLERTTQSSFYSAMKKRNDLFTQDPTPEALKNYVKYNTVITSHYEFNEGFQEKVQRHKHFLALSYAKIDAIQGVVKQNFDEYQTRVLGSSTGNNKNFIFNVDGETEKLVIRVEDRHDLGDELALQTESVSEYFSEDYATLMLPFSEEGEINYQPVVISEFAKKGDLRSYAESFSGQKPERIANEAEYIFGKLSDFSIKLMDSGHYHPDIKLTNFLTDGERVILSDRKTLTNIKNPRVTEISSSPMYGAPEYQQCVGNGTLNYKAFHTTLDMPSYMSYQVGMALKEFMFVSGVVPLSSTDEDETTQQFLDWNSITQNMKSPPNDVRNISVLIQELTRTKPTERLPLQHFQSLLTKISLPQEQFLDELNKRSPSEKLSNHQDIELIKEFLNADELTPELEKKLEALQDIDNTLQDPRLNLSALLQGKPLQRINQYIKEVNNAKIDELLLKKDLERAGWGSRFLHRLTGGRYSVPRAATLTDIKDDLPKMDNLTATCVDLYLEHGGVLSGMKPSQRNLLQQLSQLSSRDEPDMVADKDVAKYTENRTVFEKETVVPAQQISKKASPLSETNEYNTMVTHEEADTSTVVVKPILSAE